MVLVPTPTPERLIWLGNEPVSRRGGSGSIREGERFSERETEDGEEGKECLGSSSRSRSRDVEGSVGLELLLLPAQQNKDRKADMAWKGVCAREKERGVIGAFLFIAVRVCFGKGKGGRG